MLDAAADVLSTGSVVEPSVDPPVVEPSVDPEKGDLFVNRVCSSPPVVEASVVVSPLGVVDPSVLPPLVVSADDPIHNIWKQISD